MSFSFGIHIERDLVGNTAKNNESGSKPAARKAKSPALGASAGLPFAVGCL
jgi:hypothetical protein